MSVTSIQSDLAEPPFIFIKVSYGSTLKLSFDPSSKISRYKKEIEQRERILFKTPYEYQKLLFEGKLLGEDLPLSDYGIYPNATLHLVMQIFVRTLTEETLVIDVISEDSVYILKQKVQQKKLQIVYANGIT